MRNKCFNVPMFKCSNDNKGISLILTLLIISTVLTATLIVSEISFRQGQIVYGAEVSEKAYFAAKTALEKAAYQVHKNYADIGDDLSGSLSNGAEYTAEINADIYCPDITETECIYYCDNPPAPCPISNTNPWTIELEPGEAFEMSLDINGATYPSTIEVTQTGTEKTDLVLYQCETSGTPRDCSATKTQTFYVTLPQTINISDNSYFWLRINNNGTVSDSYTLTPSSSLPIGIDIDATGSAEEYERRLNQNIPKWQRFGI
jgi:hypothetical protein